MIEYETLVCGKRFEIRVLRQPQEKEAIAVQYIESVPERQRKKLISAIQFVADNGPPYNTEKCRRITGCHNLLELKEKPHRLMWFYSKGERGVIVITHGFRKKGDKTPQGEIDRAIGLRDQYSPRPQKT